MVRISSASVMWIEFQPLLGSVVQVSTYSTFLFSFHTPASLYFLQYQVSIRQKMMPNSVNFRREQRVVLADQVGFPKTFPEEPITFRVSCAARHSFGTLWSCSLSQDREIVLHLRKNSPCSVNPEFESIVDSQW